MKNIFLFLFSLSMFALHAQKSAYYPATITLESGKVITDHVKFPIKNGGSRKVVLENKEPISFEDIKYMEVKAASNFLFVSLYAKYYKGGKKNKVWENKKKSFYVVIGGSQNLVLSVHALRYKIKKKSKQLIFEYDNGDPVPVLFNRMDNPNGVIVNYAPDYGPRDAEKLKSNYTLNSAAREFFKDCPTIINKSSEENTAYSDLFQVMEDYDNCLGEK